MALQIRRGTNQERLNMTPQAGEVIHVTDSEISIVTVTALTGATDLLTAVNHGLVAGQKLRFIANTQQGLIEQQLYFVRAGATQDQFTVSLTLNGSAVNLADAAAQNLLFAESPSNAAGEPLGTSVSPLFVGDGETTGGLAAGATTLDELADVEIGVVGLNGIVLDSNQHLQYDSATNQFRNVNNVIVPGTLAVQSTADSTSKDSGSVVIEGGVGIEKAVFVGTNLRVGGATNSTSKDTGALIVLNGGVGVELNITAGAAISAGTNVSAGEALSAGTTLTVVQAGTIGGNLAVNGGALTTTSASFNLVNTTAGTVNFAGAANSVNIGGAGSTTQLAGDLRVNGNQIKGSTGVDAVTINGANVSVAGDLTVSGNDIRSSTANAITLSGANVAVAGDLTVTGNDILSSTGAVAITLSGNDVSMPDRLTVTNEIFLSGSQPFVTFGDGTTSAVGAELPRGIRGVVTEDDKWFVGAGAVGDDQGFLMIAISDNGATAGAGERIIVRKVGGSGTANTRPEDPVAPVLAELQLFDNNNFTTVPVRLGIGNGITAPAAELDLTGSALISGNVTVSGVVRTDLIATELGVASADPVTIARASAFTNSSSRALTIRHVTTGTPAAGIGTTLEFETETAAGVVVPGFRLSSISNSVAAGAESFDLEFRNRKSGNMDVAMTLTSAGELITAGDITVLGNDIRSSTGDAAISMSGKNVTVAGVATVLDATQSVSPGTGSLLTAGGVGIAKNLHVAGTIRTDDTAVSTSHTTGSIRTAGGLGVSGAIFANSGLNLTGGTVVVSSTEASTTTTTGSIRTAGGLGVAGAANIGGAATVGGSLTVTGDFTVNGTTTTINSTVVSVDDKAIELAAVAVPTDDTANDAGIIIKGTTDKTLLYKVASNELTSNTAILAPHLRSTGTISAVGNIDTNGNLTVLGSTFLGNTVESDQTVITGRLAVVNSGVNNIETLAATGVTTVSNLVASLLRVGDNTVRNSSNTAVITMTGSNVAVAGQLTVTGNQIRSSGSPVLDFSGANISAPGNVSVLGSLDAGTVLFNSDKVSEGATNQYYAEGKVDANFATKTTSALNEGTNLYYTDVRARNAVSVTDTGGDGSLSYNSGTGVITYTGPTATEVRAHLSGGTGVTYTAGTGEIAIGQSVATSADVTFNTVNANITDDNYVLGQLLLTRNTAYIPPATPLSTLAGQNGIVVASSSGGAGFAPAIAVRHHSGDTTAGVQTSASLVMSGASGTSTTPGGNTTNQVMGTMNFDGYTAGTSNNFASVIASANSGGTTAAINPLQAQGYARQAFVNSVVLTTAVTGASGTGSVATLTFTTQNTAPYAVGQTVTVAGMTPSGYNGTVVITAATTSSISYANVTTGFTSGGTIAAGNTVTSAGMGFRVRGFANSTPMSVANRFNFMDLTASAANFKSAAYTFANDVITGSTLTAVNYMTLSATVGSINQNTFTLKNTAGTTTYATLNSTSATLNGDTVNLRNTAGTTTYVNATATGTTIIGAGLSTVSRTTVGTPGLSESRPSMNIQLIRSDQAAPADFDGTSFRSRVGGSNGTFFTISDIGATYRTSGDVQFNVNLANGDQTGSNFSSLNIFSSSITSTRIKAGTASGTAGGSAVSDVAIFTPTNNTLRADALTLTNYANVPLKGGNISYRRTFGCFHKMADVTAATADTVFNFDWTTDTTAHVNTQGVTVSNTSRINIDTAGNYNAILEMHVQNTDNANREAYVWLARNGTDLSETCIKAVLTKDTSTIITKAWLVDGISANDYLEVRFAVDNISGISLQFEAAQSSPYVRPAVASATITIEPVGA